LRKRSASARIRAAYCLGLITKDQYDDLNLIRRIRNKFAHRLHDLSFKDKEILDWCNSLKMPKKTIPRDWSASHADIFVAAVAILSTQLELEALDAQRHRRAVPHGADSAKKLKSTYKT
jgi:DNA-binding MltR family transcriptional regulator